MGRIEYILGLNAPSGQGSPAPSVEAVRSTPAPGPPAGGEYYRRIESVATADPSEAPSDVRRITNLELVHPLTPPESEWVSSQKILASAYADGFRLTESQANGIYAFERYRGLLGSIGVGRGKTLLSLLIAQVVHGSWGMHRSMLIVPSQVVAQLRDRDIRWARSRIPLNFPIYFLCDGGVNARRTMAMSGRRGLYVWTYSLLSARDADDVLAAIKPQHITLDEAQNAANFSAARTKRLLRYILDRHPTGAAMSGTLSSKSIKDYFHLSAWALGNQSPLPLAKPLVEDWAALLDAQAMSEDDPVISAGRASPMSPLISWARNNFPNRPIPHTVSGFREAYRLRITHNPGVVSSGDADIGTSLTITNDPVPHHEKAEGWTALKELMDKVEMRWETPNDDPIEYALHQYKWLYELTAGFWHRLSWPTPDAVSRRKGVSIDEAIDIVGRSMQAHELHNVYAKCLRTWLERNARPGLDSPFLVGGDMERYGAANVGEELYDTWVQWKESCSEDLVDRDSTAIRVSDYKIREAVAWASKHRGKGGIVWVHHQEIGRWCFEMLRDADIDAIHCPAGSAQNERIIDEANANKIVVASMTAHGTGKNLQHFREQFFLQWPRPAKVAEQVLGRTHRLGQKADDLVVHTCNTTEFDHQNFAATLIDALYIHQTLGNRQKLIICGYNPLPRLYPSAVLRQRGFESRVLTSQEERVFFERFRGEVSE